MLDRSLAVLAVGALVACSSASEPAACDVTHPTPVVLGIGGNAGYDVCSISFPANASSTDSAEYLIVAQSAGGGPGGTAAFKLVSNTVSGAAAATTVARPEFAGRPGGALAAQFDAQLRRIARGPAPIPPGMSLQAAAVAPPARAITRPQLGDTRQFPHVCSNLGCTTWDIVTGQVKAISNNVAIYVDTNRPGDLSQAGLDSLALVFDQHVYQVDTATYGREPDTDSNGVVVVLLTGVVNALSNPATCFTTGYVAGFFFSPDLDLQVAALYNKGEIMYGLVADTNAVYSCRHTVSAVKRLLPATFLHELEHMINYNQHVRVKRGNAEDIWLDEAMANFAEELGGRSFFPDSTTFLRYVQDDLNDAYEYLYDPQDHWLLSPTDQNLPDNGAGWMFVRYLVDQQGDLSVLRRLVQTTATGTTNVQQATGLPFSVLVANWALANYVSDLPGFVPKPELRYTSWNFRQAFAALRAADTTGRYPIDFPLVPIVSAGAQVNVGGSLHAGSGIYVRAVQAPSAASFSLEFTGPTAAPLPNIVIPRLVVLRVR